MFGRKKTLFLTTEDVANLVEYAALFADEHLTNNDDVNFSVDKCAAFKKLVGTETACRIRIVRG